MSKSNLDLQKLTRTLLTHQPVSIVLIFIGEFLRQKEDFPHQFTRVGNAFSRSIFCESVKIGALVGREKIFEQ